MTRELLPFSRVWPELAARVRLLPDETRPLGEALGLIARAPLCARWPLPRFDASAMDGVAVDSTLLDGEPPHALRLAPGGAYAAPGPRLRLAPGEALPIGTGGLLPLGADAVVPRERVQRSGEEVIVQAAVRSGDHVRRRGEEFQAGDVVVPAGELITPAALAAAIGAGVSDARVARRVRVALVTTGSELVPAGGGEPAEGEIVDTNGPFLAASLARMRLAEVVFSRHAPDEVEATREGLGDALACADVLVVCGGVSVGDRDLVKDLLEESLGVERVFWRVAQKPGKPLYAGVHAGGWVLGLPGNPGAVATAYAVVVEPLLRALAGARAPWPRPEPVRLGEEFAQDPKRTLLRWARSRLAGGELEAQPAKNPGSHMLGGLVGSDLLLIVPPGEKVLARGSRVPALRIRP